MSSDVSGHMPGTAAPASPADQGDPDIEATPRLTLRKLLFSFDGRIGNGAYIAGTLLPIASIIAVGMAIQLLSIPRYRANGTFPPISTYITPAVENALVGLGIALAITLAILWFWIKLALAAKRCHDINVTGLVILLALIPYVGFFMFLWLVIWPGTPETNRWGNTMRWNAP